MSRAARSATASFRARALFAFCLLGVAATGLAARAVHLQVVKRDFLVEEGEARAVRDVTVEAHRGAILDRNGNPLAISTPMQSVWADPRELVAVPERWPELAKKLGRDRGDLGRKVSGNQNTQFLWLARMLPPDEAQAVLKMKVPGVYTQTEYRRFYPHGEMLGHLLGITSQSDQGIEGLELLFNSELAGEDGLKRVIRDSRGRRVQDVEDIRPVREGRDLVLALDTRLQFMAYSSLKRAVDTYRAASASLVLIDIPTGQVLAMVNQPAVNPNDLTGRAVAMKAGALRNRAVTDMLEPGSSIKPFVVAAALESGRFDGASVIDTGTGSFETGGVLVKDEHPLGVLDLAGVLSKSSNVAMAKIARELESQQMWGTLTRFGFGRMTAVNFPGESAGTLPHYSNWTWSAVASLSRGYNLSVTPLQLAQAYATLGGLGVARPVSLQKVDGEVPGTPVMNPRNARTLISLLEAVVKDGTGTRAAIPGYRVAGKTGTAWKAKDGERGYHQDRYVAVFGGIAPASNPRLAAVVVIDDPRADKYYGGEIAAPVFSEVVGSALRLLGVAPDARLDDKADPLTGVATVVTR